MQIGYQIVELSLCEGFSHRRHHVAPPDDRLLHKAIGRRQSARQEFLAENILKARPFTPRG